MSQNATLLSISENDIQDFIASPEKVGWANIAAVAKNNIEVQGSFLALEYLLSKGLPTDDQQLIREIFSPDATLGEPLDDDDYARIFELLESGKSIPYISQQRVGLIYSLLDKITPADVAERYNADELNQEEIYPSIWHNDNAPDKSFNKQHLLTDFELIKNLFATAVQTGDSIVSVVS
ncbi:MAG: hypothetical protein BGO70_16415 [Bacteroidetes bacterium 43-93]|nr:DUF1877 family protein [Bacteroidota bacterium]OJX01346.1 MAG: hypothetical protein BGO70_16415 [Bacteroidetes bacterium 43-93]